MCEWDRLCDFQNLYRAHRAARRGKQGNAEVIRFELRLGENLTRLSEELRSGTYRIAGYYSFRIYDPKERLIHALHYRDRVVQHCLCDELLAPVLEKRLIYDNAACRIGKGTDFARNRLTGFLRGFYRHYGADGWFLKCDIRKFFDNIDHAVLKQKLRRVFTDERLLRLLDSIIDSYCVTPGKGLPLGNQTSQWFAIYYLDGLDRLIKERLRVRYYTRYMDDFILLGNDKRQLHARLDELRSYLRDELQLELNQKTQVFPLRNGAEYLGFRFYLNENGGVVRRLCRKTKTRYKHRLRQLRKDYRNGLIDWDDARQVLNSYRAHLLKGHTYRLLKAGQGRSIFVRGIPSNRH